MIKCIKMSNSVFKSIIAMLLCILLAVLPCGCTQEKIESTAADTSESHIIEGIKPINQNPDYPTGCESVSAVMALKFMGYNISISRFVARCLSRSYSFYIQNETLYGPDPYEYFCGDPKKDTGYGCMAPVIKKAIVVATQSKQAVKDTTGTDLETLCTEYIAKDIPVIVWATVDMKPSGEGDSWMLKDGTQFVWWSGEHALLLMGYDKTTYYFADPMKGEIVQYDKELTAQRFEELGCQSVVITKKNK